MYLRVWWNTLALQNTTHLPFPLPAVFLELKKTCYQSGEQLRGRGASCTVIDKITLLISPQSMTLNTNVNMLNFSRNQCMAHNLAGILKTEMISTFPGRRHLRVLRITSSAWANSILRLLKKKKKKVSMTSSHVHSNKSTE